MSKKKQPYVLYDSQVFDMQRFGGISRYFCEIIKRLNIASDITVRYSINYYLTAYNLGKHRIPLPRFIFKHYRKQCINKNKKLGKAILSKDNEYLFHPTYYDPYFLKYIGNRPYVITVHDMIHEKFPFYFSDAEKVIKQKKEVISNANRIIAISENTKKDIIELLHINPDKIDVIYHSTSMKRYNDKYSLQLPLRYILFVGDRAPYKNFERFIEAISLVLPQYKDLSVVCTTPSFNKKEDTLIQNLNLTDRIHQIKASDKELSELYSRAELFVFPSLYEGFGIPILEAYACQCPVALSNTSCFPEIAGKAGIYFDPYSPNSIANSIMEILNNEKTKAQLINEGNKRLELYSWEKAALKTENVYKKILDID